MSLPKLHGTYTALVTPFTASTDAIDMAAFDKLLEHQLAGGITGVVPCGTTGESPTLSPEEQKQLVKRCVVVCKGRAQVIAGTGSNDTRRAVEATKEAVALGVDAVMVVAPYYNKPSQEGLFQHFRAVASSVNVPVIVYNVPGRTGIDIAPTTIARLVDACPNVTCTKEATGNVIRAQQLACLLGDRLTVLCGDDALTLPMISVGASGVISVTANVLPREVVNATSLALAGRFAEARKAHLALMPVHDAMFVESNPAPAKAALAARGMMLDAVRAPLVAASDGAKRTVAEALTAFVTPEPTPSNGARAKAQAAQAR